MPGANFQDSAPGNHKEHTSSSANCDHVCDVLPGTLSDSVPGVWLGAGHSAALSRMYWTSELPEKSRCSASPTLWVQTVSTQGATLLVRGCGSSSQTHVPMPSQGPALQAGPSRESRSACHGSSCGHAVLWAHSVSTRRRFFWLQNQDRCLVRNMCRYWLQREEIWKPPLISPSRDNYENHLLEGFSVSFQSCTVNTTYCPQVRLDGNLFNQSPIAGCIVQICLL